MRKITKTILATLLTLIMCVSAIPAFSINALAAEPRLSHVSYVNCMFVANESGGQLEIRYSGYESFEKIDVNVKLQKKFLLVFWTNVDEWSTSSTNPNGILSHVFALNGKGTYKATFTVTVTGIDGTVDTFTEEIESKY